MTPDQLLAVRKCLTVGTELNDQINTVNQRISILENNLASREDLGLALKIGDEYFDLNVKDIANDKARNVVLAVLKTNLTALEAKFADLKVSDYLPKAERE